LQRWIALTEIARAAVPLLLSLGDDVAPCRVTRHASSRVSMTFINKTPLPPVPADLIERNAQK